MRRLGFAVWLLLAAGCRCGGTGYELLSYPCVADSDCAEGRRCVDGTCGSTAPLNDGGTDAGIDAGQDGGADAGPDAGEDGGSIGEDAGTGDGGWDGGGCGPNDECPVGQRCAGGNCICDAFSCPSGCCAGTSCRTPSVSTCGREGAGCVACSAVTADSCSAAGSCQCGAWPTCAAGQRCVSGQCVCDPTSCATGCCSGTSCGAPSLGACGGSGAACTACDANRADNCSSAGACQCGTGPACAGGQRCVGALCVCDATSCPAGCCSGTSCLTRALPTCGVGGATCVACDAAISDNCSSSGACRCGSGPSCGTGQTCASGSCSGGACDSTNCPSGCCAAGVCNSASPSTCGTAGSACLGCDASKADGCSASGTCQCGTSAECVPGQRCLGGACVCDATSCPLGCCSAGACSAPALTGCGTAGAACATCDIGRADSCTAGACRCGANPACQAGQRCAAGSCICDALSCASGCCAGGACQTPTVTACGTSGAACAPCDPALADGCATGSCRCGAAPACGAGCACVAGVRHELACTDGFDNDDDGSLDCADPDCDARACGGTSVCTASACTCIGSVAVHAPVTSVRSTSIAGSALAPRLLFVTDGQLRYAECTQACDTARPTFQSAALAPTGMTGPFGATITDIPGGGVGVAVTSQGPKLWYGECVAGCLTASAWTWTLVASNTINQETPVVAASASWRAIAYGGGADTRYAECGASCSQPGSWTLVKVAGPSVKWRAGVWLAQDGGTLERHVSNQQLQIHCSSGCGSEANWNAVTSTLKFGSSEVSRSALPRAVGVADNGGTLGLKDCNRLPCGTGDWKPEVTLASDAAQVGDFGFRLDSAARGVVVYQMNVGNLGKVQEGPTGWNKSTVQACGAALAGSNPALLISPADSPRILFFAGGALRYHVAGP